MGEPYVVVIGAASMDTRGRAKERLVPATSNRGTIRVSAGGVGRNVAENLARLGIATHLLSAVGDDEAGRHILEVTAVGGVDTSRVIVSHDLGTAAYLAILDEQGAKAVSIDDMKVMQEVTPRYIHAQRSLIAGARMVAMDTNLSSATIASVLKIAERANVPVCVDPVAVTLAHRIKGDLSRLYLVTPDAGEAEILSDLPVRDLAQAMAAAQRLVSLGVDIAIITLGQEGLCYASSEESGKVPAIKCEVVDATGAGDALSAAVVYGMVSGFPLSEAVRLGVSAAALTLKCSETVCPELSLEQLYDQLVM